MLQALCWPPDIYAILNSESHLLLQMKKLKPRKVKLHLHGQMAKQSGAAILIQIFLFLYKFI